MLNNNGNISPATLTRSFCTSSVLNFTRFFFVECFKRKFIVGQHHQRIAEALDKVVAGEIKNLIINIAPRFGKTELAVKNFISYGFAINPKSKFIHLSYSDSLVRSNSAGVQEICRSPKYRQLFPGATPTTKNTSAWSNESGGSLYAVSSAGQVTGFGAGLVDEEDDTAMAAQLQELNEATATEKSTFGGAIIIDDPLKPEDALSPIVREKINFRFDNTIRSRVNSRNTPIIIIMQRLHEDDLCGYLLKNEPDKWQVLSLPAITTAEDGTRQALWPFKLDLPELDELRRINPYTFDTQYMQNPRPLQGLMYEQGFKTYSILPWEQNQKVKNYTDTADTGTDYLCSITYIETSTANYVLDVIYTQKPMEYTEVAVPVSLSRFSVETANIESNNGGRSFARTVEKNLRMAGNNKTFVKWFFQGENKQSRIFTHSAEVQNLVYFPEGWQTLWPEFYRDITNYKKTGANAHDDAPDALTGTVEFRPKKINNKKAAGYFGR